MITLCTAAKGGSGCTLVASLGALRSPGPVLVVDLAGDVPAMLGVDEPDRPGVVDWLASGAPGDHLDDLVLDVAPERWVLPATSGPRRPTELPSDPERWEELLGVLERWAHDTGCSVTVDAGTLPLPGALVRGSDHRWLVTRACYLALRRAARAPGSPTGVVLVEEPGRALGWRDVEASLGVPVVAVVGWSPRIARAVDAGLLRCGRLPSDLDRAVAALAS